MEGVIGMEKVLLGFAAALAIGLSALATGWAQSRIGAAGAGLVLAGIMVRRIRRQRGVAVAGSR